MFSDLHASSPANEDHDSCFQITNAYAIWNPSGCVLPFDQCAIGQCELCLILVILFVVIVFLAHNGHIYFCVCLLVNLTAVVNADAHLLCFIWFCFGKN